MSNNDLQKLKETLLYILNQTEGLDYYRIFKILYFAEKEHIKNFGSRIVADSFAALPHGPVPSYLYNAIKQDAFNDIITVAGDDAPTVLLPKRESDTDYLSLSDTQCLDKAIDENVHLTFSQLREKSHDAAWGSTARCKLISTLSIAKAAGASKEMLEYIQEQEQIAKALA